MKTALRLLAVACFLALPTLGSPADPATVTVHPAQIIGPISPFIYGTNQTPDKEAGATVWRLGGNRLTGCNWETNASNAGNDWKQSSDNWLCTGAYRLSDCDEPGAIFYHFVEKAKDAGMQSLVTIPMVDYVAADEKGPVSAEEKAPSDRWFGNFPVKNGKLTYPPDLKDKAVYEDELVNYLIQSFGSAAKGGVRFYDLDNEPGIWGGTHPRIHPAPVRYDEMIQRTEAYSVMITQLDPSAEILGPVSYGWQEFMSLQNAPDSGQWNAKFGTYLDFYLDSLARLSQTHGRRLLHALDLHFYPEARGGGKRITEGDVTPEAVEARLQAPRSLWDPTYVEDSWITEHSTGGKPIRLIPWVKEIIAKRYPGTKLAISEYDYGAGQHVSGGLALADVLGVYGREGVYLACLWADWKSYHAAAFKLYRDFDDHGDHFGDTAVAVDNPDPAQLSVYASVDAAKPGTLYVVVIHKNQKDSRDLRLALGAAGGYQTYNAYGFGEDSFMVKALGKGQVKDGVLDYKLPPLSATIFVLSK